ncbi:hypothetical protein CDV31_016301 [Fusarium ambrosium]|uniref:Uncharacterized protein n=1 Tax=Fusarium ambrosium TaxID=131363 RepID=A0A428SBM8_9HYPO|nr:hypothetical protein CDV31_016301 [Fusarium ambrosium]
MEASVKSLTEPRQVFSSANDFSSADKGKGKQPVRPVNLSNEAVDNWRRQLDKALNMRKKYAMSCIEWDREIHRISAEMQTR